jgi:hypothetical protein
VLITAGTWGAFCKARRHAQQPQSQQFYKGGGAIGRKSCQENPFIEAEDNQQQDFKGEERVFIMN